MNLATQQVPMDEEYATLVISGLTSQQECYVRFRVRGLNPMVSARSAGYTKIKENVELLEADEHVQHAIAYGRETIRQTAINAGAIEFTKDDATALYLEAHAKSANTMEEVRAVDSLVKLHGLAAAEKKEINITSSNQLEELDDNALMKLAGNTFDLSPEDYEET